MKTINKIVRKVGKTLSYVALPGMLTYFFVVTAKPQVGEFSLPGNKRAIVQESIWPEARFMRILNRDSVTEKDVRTEGKYALIDDKLTGKRYAVTDSSYISQEDSSEIPFGNDPLSQYLQSTKAQYDSLRALVKEGNY